MTEQRTAEIVTIYTSAFATLRETFSELIAAGTLPPAALEVLDAGINRSIDLVVTLDSRLPEGVLKK